MGTPIKLPMELTPDQREYLERIAEQSKPVPQKVLDNTRIPGPNFDPALSPGAQCNIRAAKARNWRYDSKRRAYRDADRSLVADRFGQLY